MTRPKSCKHNMMWSPCEFALHDGAKNNLKSHFDHQIPTLSLYNNYRQIGVVSGAAGSLANINAHCSLVVNLTHNREETK